MTATVAPATARAGTATYQAIWPVLDQRPVQDLRREALPQLASLLASARVVPVGASRWCIRPGQDVPGSGGAGQVLEARVVVAHVPREIDDPLALCRSALGLHGALEDR